MQQTKVQSRVQLKDSICFNGSKLAPRNLDPGPPSKVGLRVFSQSLIHRVFSVGISYVTNLDLLHTNYNRRVNKYNGILLPALMMETIFFWIHLNEVTYFDPHVVE